MIALFLAVWLVFFRKKIPNISVRSKSFIPNFPFVGEIVVHWTYEAWLSVTAEGKWEEWASPEIIRSSC